MALITGRETLPIPHEDGEEMTLRALPPKQLTKAADARWVTVQQARREMGVEFVKFIAEQQAARASEQPAASYDPLGQYDLWTLLELGIASWSYDAPVSPETIEQLDGTTATWAAREILRLSGIVTEPEAARKNG